MTYCSGKYTKFVLMYSSSSSSRQPHLEQASCIHLLVVATAAAAATAFISTSAKCAFLLLASWRPWHVPSMISDRLGVNCRHTQHARRYSGLFPCPSASLGAHITRPKNGSCTRVAPFVAPLQLNLPLALRLSSVDHFPLSSEYPLTWLL